MLLFDLCCITPPFRYYWSYKKRVNMKKIILILISAISVSACSTDDSAQHKMIRADKIIFGSVYGMCGGDCRDLFLINNEAIFKDGDNASDGFGDWFNTTFEERLDQEEYNNVENLLIVPSNLMQRDILKAEEVQSWADVDYYIYIEKDGKSQELILDHMDESASPEIKSYFAKFLKNYEELGGYIIDPTN